MRSARVQAQAKINVWLHVLGRRPDGFHEVMTQLQRIDLADDIVVRIADAGTRGITVTGPQVPPDGLGPDESNLAFRAAEEFRARAHWPEGFEIELTKNIPVGGGLGGGSADAGAVLRALNALAPTPLDARALNQAAAALGADVAFLASEEPAALATGRGDVLQPIRSRLPRADVLLVVPSFAINTAEAYGWLRASDQYHRPSERGPSVSLLSVSRPWSNLDRGNTFERVVETRFPVVREYRQRLEAAGASVARLSGSGSTVFGVFEGGEGAPEARSLGIDALVIATQTSNSVVRVEVQE